MRNIITIMMLSLFALLGYSQAFQVSRIEAATLDISAQALSREDANGVKCALIRVQLPVEGALFEGSIVGDVAFKTNHYLLYMPYTSKRVKVSCPGLHSVMIEFADFNINLVSGAAYDIYCDLAINRNDDNNGGTGKHLPPIAYKDNTGYGFKDIDGNIVVPPIYKEVLDYRDGIAWVKNDKSLWGSINEKGEIVVENKYVALSIIGPQQYEQNICIAGWKSDNKGDYAEIIDYKTGELLNKGRFKSVFAYENDSMPFICCINLKGNTVCIDKTTGTELSTLHKNKSFVDYAYPNYMIIYDGDIDKEHGYKPRYGIYNSHGDEIIKCNHSQIKKYDGKFKHIIAVYPDKFSDYKFSAFLYDLKLKRQIGGKYYDFRKDEEAHEWGCPLVVTENCSQHWHGYISRCGLLNLITGEEIIAPDYFSTYDIIYLPPTPDDPITARRANEKSIIDLLDMEGKVYKTFETEGSVRFRNGFSNFKKDGKEGIINSMGEVIVPPEYDSVGSYYINKNGTLQCEAKKNGKTYFIDTNGNIL